VEGSGRNLTAPAIGELAQDRGAVWLLAGAARAAWNL
jgi:hypothetical protein